jgi:phosphoenolpyruvate carboxylase
MDHQSSFGLQQFKNQVAIKFQLYNSLFTSLPFHRIEKTGILLSLLLTNCEEGYKKKLSPEAIIEDFFNRHTSYRNEQEKVDLLFRFVQYVERQVVLFDALEDAAFRLVNDMNGIGSLKHLENEVIQESKYKELENRLKEFAVRLVLTAHPTQFYPGSVLGIINDLSRALAENNTAQVNMYLQQLGKTPFLNKVKPTPYDEAISLIWYLENVFYVAAGRILSFLKNQFPQAVDEKNPVIHMGFWPGGDRDGNPFVTVDTTMKVADILRGGIIKCYYLDVRRIKRRLTFKGVETLVADLEKELYNNIFIPGHRTAITKEYILGVLNQIKDILIFQHNGLFQHLVENLINKVHVFGLHFTTLDIRQDSSVHGQLLEAIAEKENILPKNYKELTNEEKIKCLIQVEGVANPDLYEGVLKDSFLTFKAIQQIQEYNGVQGCNRYIISHSTSELNILEVYALFVLSGWKRDSLNINIVPLFETIDDLKAAGEVMRTLYEEEFYKKHLKRLANSQTIMLGFSDGTKDGGYLMANWAIFKAKKELTKISKEHGVDVVFFDGRGGPPARGGGKTHRFYASMGRDISNKEIQLTIQGQTVSSNFGTVDSAQFNIEQLINAGVSTELFHEKEGTLDANEEELIQELAEIGLTSYNQLKNHPEFLNYLSYISPLRFYSETNIASRPSKRSASSRINLNDLRAIPFVGAWSQLKQNISGYFGVGTALEHLDKKGRFPQLKQLYTNSLFFKTLMDNCEMAMKKCYFPLTEYLAADPQYGELWRMLFSEFELTRRYLLQLSGKTELMADYPVESLSIHMRERIVLPLTTIQQYALKKIRTVEEQMVKDPMKEVYEKLVVRSAFGIVNAGRNSV